jgi:hypothetical protein
VIAEHDRGEFITVIMKSLRARCLLNRANIWSVQHVR